MIPATPSRIVATIMAFALASCASVPPTPPAPLPPAQPAELVGPVKPPEPPPPTVAELPPADELSDVRGSEVDPAAVARATVPLHSDYGDLWEHIRQGFTLADIDTPEVKVAEEWYSTRPDYMARMVERSRRYLYYIVTEVEKRGMPLEIALLPMIESAYNPMAYSTGRASGIWQFVPSTGKSYGMKQTWWTDERRDVVAATEGALDYLQRLYAEFNDWPLSFAAYNWGEGSVRRAIAANQKRGLPTDYLSLSMPAETRNYVPKLQAVREYRSRSRRLQSRAGHHSRRALLHHRAHESQSRRQDRRRPCGDAAGRFSFAQSPAQQARHGGRR